MKKFIKDTAFYFVIFSILLGLSVAVLIYSLNKPSSSFTKKTVVINQGMPVNQIATFLEKEGLVNSAVLFNFYVRFKKINLQAGTFVFDENLSTIAVAQKLTKGMSDVTLVLYEGMRFEEYFELIAQKLPNINKDEFYNTVKSKNLEGRLFPDTYFFNADITTLDLINKLTSQYQEKTSALFKSNNTGLKDHEVLILASILEREERSQKERPIVAGILMNRLRDGELLGTDATVQYIFGKPGDWWPKAITFDMLAAENAYNTRKYVGLPPTAICNPSLNSINAVLNYADTQYYYYMHDSKGAVHYAKTLSEHEMNVRKYL